MFNIGITVSTVFDDSMIESIERTATAGADGVEFFDWESADFDALSATAINHDIEIFGTLAAGAGRTIMDSGAPALADPDSHEQTITDIKRSLEAASNLGCATLIVTVGQNDERLNNATQQIAVVDALQAVAPAAENHGITIAVEPLNTRIDHPGYFLSTIDTGVAIVAAVDSPNVKLLFDIYHQQITEGDIIRRLRQHIEYISHIHVADNPGRHEPGTGELNYERIFAAIAELNYDGYVSGEFTPAGDPTEAARTFVELADAARQ